MNIISKSVNSIKKTKKESISNTFIDVLFFCSTFSIYLFNGNRFVYLIWAFFIPFALLLFFELFFKKGIVIDKIVLISLGLIVVMLISYALNGFGSFNLTNILMILLFNVFYQYFFYKKNFTNSLKLNFLSLFLFVVVLLIMNFKNIIGGNIDRLGGEIANVNSVGITLGLAFTISLFYIFFEKKYLAVIPGLLFFVFSLLTGSKAALFILGLSVIITVFLFFGKKKLHFSFLLIVVTGGILILVLKLPAFSTIKIRVDYLINTVFGTGKGDASTIVRASMFKEALSLFIRKPLFGWGFEGYRVYGSFSTYSHSTFSEVLANFGIMGFVLLESLMVIPIITAINNTKSQGKNTAFPIMIGLVLLLSQIATMILGAKYLYLMIAALNGSVLKFEERKTVLLSKKVFKRFIKHEL